MACVLRENLPEEVAAFRDDVWTEEPIFLDHKFQLFAAIAGGIANEITVEAYMSSVKSPTDQDKENQAKAKLLSEGYMNAEHHNMVGQGLMTGGVYVVRCGGAVEWAHFESFVGDTADPAEVLAAAKAAAAVAAAEPAKL